MAWNYRIIRTSEGYGLHEVYYGPDGEVMGWAETPILFVDHDEGRDGIARSLDRMLEAVDRPDLDAGNLPK